MARIRLEQVLKRKKITKYRFAKMLEMETSNTAKFFKPGYDPRLSTVARWAKVLDVGIAELIED